MSNRTARVVVVGAINVDHVLEVERIPSPGEGVHASAEHEGFGGKGGNAATAAARMGGDVRLVARVGEDDAGERALLDLQQERVDVVAVGREVGARTGRATVMVDASGQNAIVVSRGANGLLSPAAVDRAVAATRPPATCLVSLEVPPEAALAAARAAIACGLALIVDPAPPERLPDGLLELGPILTPNDVEAGVLSGDSCPQVAAETLFSRTRAPVVITRGAAGALVRDRAGVEIVPAPTVLARDSTGAGDVLAGALAVALAEGQSLRAGLRLAVAAAALSVTAPGARTGPTRAAAASLASSLDTSGEDF